MFPEKYQFKINVLANSLLKVTKTVMIQYGLFNSMVGYINLVFFFKYAIKKEQEDFTQPDLISYSS